MQSQKWGVSNEKVTYEILSIENTKGKNVYTVNIKEKYSYDEDYMDENEMDENEMDEYEMEYTFELVSKDGKLYVSYENGV